MDARSWWVTMVIFAIACAPQGDQPDQKLIQEGRIYTTWLFGHEYDKLWERFSPEMKQTFGSVADLASFASRSISHLGAERGKAEEAVKDAEPYRVYTRSASFDKSEHPMLIEWTLANDGSVTGLVVRPAVGNSERGER
jgi:hypothetical protein